MIKGNELLIAKLEALDFWTDLIGCVSHAKGKVESLKKEIEVLNEQRRLAERTVEWDRRLGG